MAINKEDVFSIRVGHRQNAFVLLPCPLSMIADLKATWGPFFEGPNKPFLVHLHLYRETGPRPYDFHGRRILGYKLE